MLKEAFKLMETEGFRALGASLHLPTFPECGEASATSDTYLECLVRMSAISMYHPVGTNAMGHHPANSVVDSKLRCLSFSLSLHLNINRLVNRFSSLECLDIN